MRNKKNGEVCLALEWSMEDFEKEQEHSDK
jgi:hypothetical protein